MKGNLKIFFLVLVGLFLAFICFKCTLNLTFFPKGIKKETSTLPKLKTLSKLEKKESRPDVSFSFSPQELTEYEGKAFTINVLINSKKKVAATDLFLSYDQQALEIEKITPGAFFSQPQELSKDINKATGKILYAVGSFTPTAGKGILASFTFKGKAGGKEAQIWLEKKTQVAVEGGEEIKLGLPEAGKYIILKQIF